MELKEMRVKNFRGYAEEQVIAIDDLTAFVGKNDAGKSTILEALAIFFGHESTKADPTDLCVSTSDRFFEVTCAFSKAPDKLILDATAETSLSSEFLLDEQGLLRIKKKWTCGTAKPKEEVFIVCQHPSNEGLDDLLLLSNRDLKSRIKERLSDAEAALVNKSNNPAMRRALWGSDSNLRLETREVPASKEDSKRIWDKLSTLLPHFALFQADRPSRDSDSEVQDPMKLAVASALAEPDIVAKLDEIVTAVRSSATELATRTRDGLKQLDPDLASNLIPQFKSDPKWSSLFSVTLEGDDGISLNKRGSGVRRMVLVSFFRAEAQRRMEEGNKHGVIYAIEEPETSQHPRNQKILLDSFRDMACTEDCQVLLTTHSPGVAGSLPLHSLRLVQRHGNLGIVRPPDEAAYEQMADELGLLPDDRVRALICVEGVHDIAALKALSRALHNSDSSFLDLTQEPRVAFVPLGGGTLSQWVSNNYLKRFGRPEFHLYDNDVAKYKESCDEVNQRGDGSSARQTQRREMENYLHEDLIEQVLRVRVPVSPDNDVPKAISDALGADPTLVSLNPKRVKERLARQAFPLVTVEHLRALNVEDEVRSWFRDIQALVQP